MLTNKQMLDILERVDMPRNTTRKNILQKNQEYSLSITLGKVRMMFGKGIANSRMNKKYPELLANIRAYLRAN